jgi:xanthosine utilization system XapX-like protein
MAAKTPVGTFGKGKRGISTGGWALRGAAAGAAASTALNAVTYLDMTVRGRAASSTAEDTVEELSDKASVPVPGDDETRQNRVQGLGPLIGLTAGVGVGVVVGLVRASGYRSPPLVGSLLTTLGIMVAANGPMTALGITDPRSWSATDWASDLVPHLAYGVVLKTTMDAFDR